MGFGDRWAGWDPNSPTSEPCGCGTLTNSLGAQLSSSAKREELQRRHSVAERRKYCDEGRAWVRKPGPGAEPGPSCAVVKTRPSGLQPRPGVYLSSPAVQL